MIIAKRNKAKLIKLINSHPKFFLFLSKLYNYISIKNRLTKKGSRISFGISMFKGLKIICYGTGNEIHIGDFVKIDNSTIILDGDNNKIVIKDWAYLNQVELYTLDENNEIEIGEHTWLCGKSHFAATEGTKIRIGDNCLFSSDIHFRTGDSHSILNMQGERINKSKGITIDDHVWVGTRVTCLKGVHVSKDSVVGATTTLCKDYATPNVIISGVPGKIMKTNITWMYERK